MQYSDMNWLQKVAFKTGKFLTENKTVQKVTEAPVIKQAGQVLGMTFDQGRYLQRKQEKELNLTKQETINEKAAYDKLVSDKNIQAQLSRDALTYNPKINDVVQAGKNVASLSNSLFSQALARIDKSTTQDWLGMTDEQRKGYKSIWDYKTASLINYAKKDTASRKVLTDPAVTQYIAYRNKIEQAGSKMNFREKLGGFGQGLVSPYMMTVNTLDSIAGEISGKKARQTRAKKDFASYFGRTDLMQNAASTTYKELGTEYLTRQMGWMDLFPVLGPAVEGVAKISKVGKYGKLGVGLIESGESAIKAIGSSNIKTAFNLDPALKKFAQESKFAFEGAKEADMFKFIQDNPGIKSPLLEKLRKVVPEDLVKHVDELDSSVTKYASTFKYPKNTAKEIVKSFYMMTPSSLKVPGTMFGVQVGTEALAEVTGNDSFREVGSVLTNPAAGIVHMMGRGKSAYSDRAYKEYAEGYGYTVDELKALPDDDPLKKEINQTIDMMYNNTTFSQAVGILPKSTLGKLGAGLMDSILAFGGMAGISKAGSYGMKKAGLSNINLVHPTDKDGNLKIKMFQDIETRIGKIEDLDQQQAALEKELQTILANDKPIGIIEGTKIARLLDESAQRMKDLGEIASQVYGTKTIGGILAKYDQAIELLRSGEPTDYVRGQATQLMKEAWNGMTSLVETTQKTTGADQFTKEYVQAQNRFMMSAAALFNLRDMEGLQASVTKKAIKMSAKSYNSRGRMILEGEVIKNFATVRDGAFQASHIANTFKGLEREANVLKEMYKLQTEGDFTYKRWMNQEVDHAINKRIATQLSNIRDSEAYEKLFSVIKSEVVNTVHYGVFFSRKDGMKPNELETISNSILKKIFMGDSFKKDSPLGSALSKIGPKTSAGDSIIKDVIDGAAKLSYQIFGEKMQEYTKDKEFRFNHVKDMIQGLQGISQVQKSLNILTRMRSFTDMANSPLEMKAMGMEMTKEQEDKMFELAKGEVDVGTIDTLKNIREQFDDETISNMDVDTQSTYLIKGLDIIDTALEKQSEAIVKMENEQKDMTNQINSINKAVNEIVGLPVASKIDGKVSPEDAAYKKDMVAMMNSAKSFVSNVQKDSAKADLEDIINNERGEPSDNTINIEQLYPSSFIINSIGAKAKKDSGFKFTRGKNNVDTDAMLEIIKKSNRGNFIDNVLINAGYDKEGIEHIKTSDIYSEDLWNINNKYDNFKDGVDINARTIFYNADGTVNTAKSMEKNIQQESKGFKNLGSMGKDAVYISRAGSVPLNIEDFGKRNIEREKNIREKIGPDRVLILKNDTSSDFISLNKESVRKSALKDIGKELDHNQLEQYAALKNAGVVERLLKEGQTNPDILKILTDANPEVWQHIIYNMSKYYNKINSHNIKVDRPISSIVLKDGKSQIDGTYFIVDPILQHEGRRAKFIGNERITGMKAGSSEAGFLLKGFGEFGNKDNIKELVMSDKENIERLQTILGTTETKPAKLVDLLWKKVEAGEVSMIIPDTSIKESMKNIDGYPKELLKTNSKEIFYITDLRLYPQVSTTPNKKINQVKMPQQYIQNLVGEKGDIIVDSLQNFIDKDIESPEKYVFRIFELLSQGDFKNAQKILADNLHKFSRDDIDGILDLTNKSGNIYGVSSKQLQGLLKSLLYDNTSGTILKGITRTASGVPIRHDTIIKKTFNLPDSYYTIVSKKLFDKNWKTGDHIIFGTNPTPGPKATIGLKVIFIEDLPKEIQEYYKINGGDKLNAYFPLEIQDQYINKQGKSVSKTPGRGAERDFDGDQINLYTDFAKSKPVRGEYATIGDLMYAYTKDVIAKDITWDTSTKSGFEEYKKAYGKSALNALTPGFSRLNSKGNVGIASAKQRVLATAHWESNEGSITTDPIEFASQMQKPIQNSVDAALFDDPSKIIIYNYYTTAYPGLFLNKKGKAKEELIMDLHKKYGGSNGLYQYISDKTGERSKLLKEQIISIKGSLEAYDQLIELKAMSNINMKVNELKGKDNKQELNISDKDINIYFGNFGKKIKDTLSLKEKKILLINSFGRLKEGDNKEIENIKWNLTPEGLKHNYEIILSNHNGDKSKADFEINLMKKIGQYFISQDNVKAGGISKDKAESMLAQEKARLLKLNEGSNKVSINKLKKIPGILDYDTKNNKHWVNKIENNINNAKVLQSGIFFTLLSKEMPDISVYKGKKVIDDMKLWGNANGLARWEIKDDPALDTAMQDKNAALFALSTNNYHVLPYVQKYHPDVIEAWARIRQHVNMDAGWTDMVATILGTQQKYSEKELRYFGKEKNYKDPIADSNNKLTYWNYMAKLALGDFEGANAILKYSGKSEKDFTKEFNTEEYSHLEDATMSMVQDTMKTDDTIPTTENKSQEIVYRKIVNDFLKKEIDNIQVNMDKLGSAYNAKNTLIRDMYQYYKNTDANLLAKRDDPLKSFIRTLPNGDKLYEAGQVQTFFRQAIESMKDVIPADLIQKRIQFEQQGKAKQYESDLGKTFKKNSRDVAIESMKEVRRVHALEMHEVNLKLWNEVRDVIIADPKFAASVTKYMGEIVRANPKMNWEQARENAIQEMINQTSKDTANRLTQETQDKIREMTNAQLSKLGEVTSKIIGNVSQQMRDTSIFTEAPETLGRFLSMKMDNILIDKALKEGNASDTLGAFMQFLNTTYKSTMLSYAPGRLLTEGANSLFQTWIPSVTSWTHQKWNQLTGKPSVVGLRLHSEQAFLNKMGRDSIDLPNIGELGYAGIMKRFPEFNKASTKVFQQRSKRGESQKQSHLEKLTNVIGHNKITEFLTSKSATVNGKRIPLGFESASQIMKEKLFTHEFYTNLHDIIIHRSESNPAYMEKAKRLLTTIDQNLSKEERFQKKALLKETERLSTKNVKENFFDYTNNPIRVAGLETYVPFANFFYNSVKIMAKRPLAWLGLMTSVGNIMQDFSYPEFDVDEESLRGYYNTHKFSISILGALGFANAGVDLKRFLPIDLTNPKFFGYSYQKMFFPTNDSDFTRLMEDKNFHRYNYGLKKLAPAIGDLVSGITTNDDKSFRRRLMYMFTGLSWNDTAKFDMLKAYYKQDYSEMLNKNNYYWNQFNVRREKNGLPKMTKEDVASKKYFDELIFNGDSEGYKYLNVMADYVTYTEFVKNKSGDFFTDTDSAKAVNVSVRSMLMDMATDELRGKETTDGQSEGLKLYEKANKLNELTIDENGVTRKKKAGEKSILERMRSLGTMDEFLDRLEYYAKDYKVISQFSEANQKRWTDEGTINDNAKVAAFKYYFQEEEKDPKRAKLESENYELYYKTKVDAIMNGTLRHPIYTEVQDEVASDIAITDGYKKRLQYGKGLILTDLEKAKNNVNSYTLLKNIYRKQYNSATNPGMQSYRKSLAQRASEQVQKERNRFETLSPTFYNLNQLKSTVSNMGPASTYAEELENYKIAIAERTKKSFANYYTGKKTWYNKLLNDKGATLQFKQNNGITIEDAMNQLDFNLQTNGLSSQTTSEQTYVSF